MSATKTVACRLFGAAGPQVCKPYRRPSSRRTYDGRVVLLQRAHDAARSADCLQHAAHALGGRLRSVPNQALRLGLPRSAPAARCADLLSGRMLVMPLPQTRGCFC